jgi:hypothetical protein
MLLPSPAMTYRQRAAGIVTIAVLTLSCTPLQRRATGGAVAVVGAATASAGAYMMDPCAAYDDTYERYLCRDRTRSHDDRPGGEVMAVGLGTMLIGGIIYLTGTKLPKRHPPRAWHLHGRKSR